MWHPGRVSQVQDDDGLEIFDDVTERPVTPVAVSGVASIVGLAILSAALVLGIVAVLIQVVWPWIRMFLELATRGML